MADTGSLVNLMYTIGFLYNGSYLIEEIGMTLPNCEGERPHSWRLPENSRQGGTPSP